MEMNLRPPHSVLFLVLTSCILYWKICWRALCRSWWKWRHEWNLHTQDILFHWNLSARSHFSAQTVSAASFRVPDPLGIDDRFVSVLLLRDWLLPVLLFYSTVIMISWPLSVTEALYTILSDSAPCLLKRKQTGRIHLASLNCGAH